MDKIYFMDLSSKIEDLLDNYKYSKPANLIELLQGKYYHLMLLASIITFTTFAAFGQNDPEFIDIKLAAIFLFFGIIWRVYTKQDTNHGLLDKVFNRNENAPRKSQENLFNPDEIKKHLASMRLYGAEYPDVMAYCNDIEKEYMKVKKQKSEDLVYYNRLKFSVYGAVIIICAILWSVFVHE